MVSVQKNVRRRSFFSDILKDRAQILDSKNLEKAAILGFYLIWQPFYVRLESYSNKKHTLCYGK